MPIPFQLLDAIRQPAFLYGPDGTIAAANDRAEALAGRPIGGMTPAQVFEIFRARRPDGGPAPVEELPAVRALAGGEVVDYPLAITAPDDREIRVLVTASPVRDGDRIAGALSIWQDVTDLVAAGAALRESDQKYRTLFDSIDEGFFLIDVIFDENDRAVDLYYVEANAAATRMLGRDWTGTRLTELSPDYEPYWLEIFGEVARTGESVRQERYAAPDERWYDFYVFRIGGPESRRIGNTFLDITERKRAEATFRENEALLARVLGLSMDGIYRRNLATGRYEYANPALASITGYSPDELGGMDLDAAIEAVHPEDRAFVQAVLETPGSWSGEAEYRFRCRDGAYRWISEHFTVEAGDDGRPQFVTGVVRDVTPRRENEEALREYAENLQRSNEDLERFAYVSSHDLQEPLRSIVSFSQLLERRYRGRLDSDADEYIEFIVEGGTRMQTLIQDLLAYSRVNTTRQQFSPTDTADVLASVERSLDLQLREARATLTHDPMPVVIADPLQLEQVFAHLVSNAIKFRRPEVPLRIHVGVRWEDGICEFSVRDNGIGIETEYFGRIFVIFQRLHTKDAYPGTGIGLAIVKRIIDRHGGRIWVESSPGEGSTFVFTLPAA
jgi:PAS domain S-box-containing protein